MECPECNSKKNLLKMAPFKMATKNIIAKTAAGNLLRIHKK